MTGTGILFEADIVPEGIYSVGSDHEGAPLGKSRSSELFRVCGNCSGDLEGHGENDQTCRTFGHVSREKQTLSRLSDTPVNDGVDVDLVDRKDLARWDSPPLSEDYLVRRRDDDMFLLNL